MFSLRTMKDKLDSRRYVIKTYKEGRLKYHTFSRKINKISRILRAQNWQTKGFKVYLKVEYGRFKDNMGKEQLFYNDGEYTNQEDAIAAWDAFIAEKV